MSLTHPRFMTPRFDVSEEGRYRSLRRVSLFSIPRVRLLRISLSLLCTLRSDFQANKSPSPSNHIHPLGNT